MTAFRPARLLRTVWLSLLLGCGAPSFAQAPATGVAEPRAGSGAVEAKPGEAKPAAAASDVLKGDIIYLPGPDGELVPVPVGPTLKGYLDWVQKQAAPANGGPLPYSITNLALHGMSDDERVVLTARVQVQVTQPDEWVRVPLSMTEAVLSDFSYAGGGTDAPDRFDAEAGYAWWFKGQGNHELTLTLSVSLRKPVPTRRLQLSLPPTAVSSLKLRVPHAKVTARVVEKSTVSARAVEKESEIEVIGLGSRLDLTWQPVPELVSAETVLEASTSISATLEDGESITLEATQNVRALQGTFEELRVTLPPGYELLRVDGLEYQDHRSDPANLNQVLVGLKKPTQGPVELKWTVRAKLPAGGAAIPLEGFEVDRARIQTGVVAVGVVGDFRVTRQPEEDRFVQRVNLEQLPTTLKQEQVAAAFRFLNQPFRLVLNLQKIEPHLGSEPHLFLHFTPEFVELDATVNLHVYRGSVTEVRLRWPAWKQSGWLIESVEPAGRVEQILLDDAANPDMIRIRLSEPARGPFPLRLRAKRPVGTEPSNIALTLPAAEAAGTSPTELIVSMADNVAIDLRPAERTRLRALPSQAQPRVETPREFLKFRRQLYRVESPQPAFTAALTLNARDLKTHTEVEAATSREKLAVRQRIRYHVAFERMAQVRLLVPPALGRNQVEFVSQAGAVLVPAWGVAVANAQRELLLTLDEPRLGEIEIDVRYAIPHGSNRGVTPARQAIIPLIQSADAPYTSVRFAWVDASGQEAIVADESWIRQPTADGSSVWVAAGAKPAIELTVQRAVGSSTRGGVISKCLIRTEIDQNGSAQALAQYRISGLASVLPVAFPAGTRPLAFWWDKRPLRPVHLSDDPDGTSHFEIDLPERSGVSDHLLTIKFHSEDAPFGFSEVHRLAAPHFPPEIWMTQTLWDVSLPAKLHLFSDPVGFSPEFQWRQEGFFWHRTPNLTAAQLSHWIVAAKGPDEQPVAAAGNSYLFSQFGPPQEIEFRTMSQSSLVLIGAGLALIVGLMLTKIPATRHVLTGLSLGFAVSVIGLWFTGPVLLLLQPAGLGLLLAIVAAAIDTLVKRKRQSGVVTLSSPSGFMTVPSSINREKTGSRTGLEPRDIVAGVGSEDFTSVRPAMPSTADVGPPAETGSRA